MKNEIEESEKTESLPLPKGLNFRLLIPQLTEEFKLKVALGEIELTSIFKISQGSNNYLISLIKHDIKSKLPKEDRQIGWLNKIKKMFNK